MARRTSRQHAFAVACGLGVVNAMIACTSFESATSNTAPDAMADSSANTEDATGTDSGTFDAASSDGDAGANPHQGMVEIPGGGFFIDTHEVTNTQYNQFLLELKGGTAGGNNERSECKWKKNHERVTTSCTPSPIGDAPATCLDWCDANAYCRYYGKRLCGKIGGGSAQQALLTSPTHSEWMLACAGVSSDAYPYADAGGLGTCTTQSSDMALTPVGSKAGCVGHVPGLFDMSGNALEWEDAIGAAVDGGPEKQSAFARGGSFKNPIASCTCSYVTPAYARQQIYDNIGFRCCSP